MQPLSQPHRTKRVKTEGDRLAAQLQRQKSIFQNLSWQVKQKQRKISFLERYYDQLKTVIQRQKQQDSALMSRAHQHVKRSKQNGFHKLNILRELYPSDRKRRLVTQMHQSRQGSSIIERSAINMSLMKLSHRKK